MSKFNFQLIHFNSIDSTNSYAFELLEQQKAKEGTVVFTDFQEKGKGQLTKGWESEVGKNLLMSVVLKPVIVVELQSEWNKMVAVSLKNVLDSLSVKGVQIKWPNDILVNSKKIGGILIENSILGKSISTSVIGLGLNINQTNFASYGRIATSLKKQLSQAFEISTVMNLILDELRLNYELFLENPFAFKKKYMENLYGYGQPLRFADNESEFTGVILGILPDGRLQLNKNGKLKSYEVKQLRFLE